MFYKQELEIECHKRLDIILKKFEQSQTVDTLDFSMLFNSLNSAVQFNIPFGNFSEKLSKLFELGMFVKPVIAWEYANNIFVVGFKDLGVVYECATSGGLFKQTFKLELRHNLLKIQQVQKGYVERFEHDVQETTKNEMPCQAVRC